jgi:hypothetical protein
MSSQLAEHWSEQVSELGTAVGFWGPISPVAWGPCPKRLVGASWGEQGHFPASSQKERMWPEL